MPSAPQSIIWPSPERKIQIFLREKLEKWDWVIYRCTYEDGEAWSRFKQIVEERSHRDTLDGASKHRLHARFREWAAHVIDIENPHHENRHLGAIGIPRYEYFVMVDEGALRSVVYDAPRLPDDDMDGEGYVNFVNTSWLPLDENPLAVELSTEERLNEEQYEPIDDCREKNVGWMKMASSMLTSEFYDAMADNCDVWYCFYRRPPITVNG
ncbi:uncharacterized protein ASPGLDRAFT_36966 [Aspergillus glaucus CBS 516.65]|uniref:Uncharacterized protein n=1 Tax=Aspergillus glaucus CBS 516.65 TaxID=1160497 RepID=A0A1L9VG41_ASPGL|nr:hypothetical protein ASPGLDRAFT_36966 [Aspergillus glaucus CBS 516.65]OJJ82855.1 hypothetical protein ASPGLDRAFT_36966 [Aspergillus glaucus CBS 516.65]